MKYLLILSLLSGMAVLDAQRTPRQRSGGQAPSGESGSNLLADFRGTLALVTSKKVTIKVEDSARGEENTMEMSISRKTVALDGDRKLKVTDLHPGQLVDIEAKVQIDGSMEAVRIHLNH